MSNPVQGLGEAAWSAQLEATRLTFESGRLSGGAEAVQEALKTTQAALAKMGKELKSSQEALRAADAERTRLAKDAASLLQREKDLSAAHEALRGAEAEKKRLREEVAAGAQREREITELREKLAKAKEDRVQNSFSEVSKLSQELGLAQGELKVVRQQIAKMEETQPKLASTTTTAIGIQGELETIARLEAALGDFATIENTAKQPNLLDIAVTTRTEPPVCIRIDCKNWSKPVSLAETQKFEAHVDAFDPSTHGAILFCKRALRPELGKDGLFWKTRRNNIPVHHIGKFDFCTLIGSIHKMVCETLTSKGVAAPQIEAEMKPIINLMEELATLTLRYGEGALNMLKLAQAHHGTRQSNLKELIVLARTAHSQLPNLVKEDFVRRLEVGRVVMEGRPPAVEKPGEPTLGGEWKRPTKGRKYGKKDDSEETGEEEKKGGGGGRGGRARGKRKQEEAAPSEPPAKQVKVEQKMSVESTHVFGPQLAPPPAQNGLAAAPGSSEAPNKLALFPIDQDED
jgi:hypothetical protein